MAAAEYFSNAPMNQSGPPPYQQRPQAPTSYPSGNQGIPQVQTPPQHSNQNHGVHFANRPVDIPQRHSFSGGQHRPSLSQGSSPQPYYYNTNPYQQQNQALAVQPHQQYSSSPLSSGYHTPNRPQHLAPHMRPYANPNYSQSSLEHGYSSDPEPHRHRRHQKKKRTGSDSRSRDMGGKPHSSNKDAFLGAAGGGLVGDLIFPGLGTVGGAAIGWLGGKDFARRHEKRKEERAEAQKEWEAIHRPTHHHRDRGYSHSSRASSGNPGPGSRQRSYERRKDDY